MAAEQSMTQTITQAAIKTAKAAIIAIREADIPFNNNRLVHTVPRSGSPALKQPTFDWKVADKSQELCK